MTYFDKLKADMPQQFRDRPNLDILLEAFGRQMDEIYAFYEALGKIFAPDANGRRFGDLVGKQLDMIGDIVVLNRKNAALLTGNVSETDVLDDDPYRNYLIYKMLLNTSTCTYKDLIDGISFFVDGSDVNTIEYIEDPYSPAQFILKCDENVASKLANLKFIHAGGVGVVIDSISGEISAVLHPYFAYWFDDEYFAYGMRQQIDQKLAYVLCPEKLTIQPQDDVYVITQGANIGLYTNSKKNAKAVTGYKFVSGANKTKAGEYLMISADDLAVLGNMVLGVAILG